MGNLVVDNWIQLDFKGKERFFSPTFSFKKKRWIHYFLDSFTQLIRTTWLDLRRLITIKFLNWLVDKKCLQRELWRSYKYVNRSLKNKRFPHMNLSIALNLTYGIECVNCKISNLFSNIQINAQLIRSSI